MAPHLERTDPAAGTPQGVGSTSFQPVATAAHFDLCSPCCSLVCRVAMAAQAMSMVTRFDSSFLCRLGASVERLHHLARPSREEVMHRANSDVCTRHRMPCCICAAHSRYGSISRCTRWSRRGSLRLRRVGMIQERTEPVQTGRGTLSNWVPRATSHIPLYDA